MNWKKIVLGSTLAGTLLFSGFSGQALARWGCDAPNWTAASPADQAKLDEIRQTYDADLTSLEEKLRSTSRDLDQTLSERDTAAAGELRLELYDLERQYDALRDQAWSEMSEAGVAGTRRGPGWNCRWHDDHQGGSRGGPMMSRWSGNHGNCCR